MGLWVLASPLDEAGRRSQSPEVRRAEEGPPLQTFTPTHEPPAAARLGMNRGCCSPEHGLGRGVEREAPSSSA